MCKNCYVVDFNNGHKVSFRSSWMGSVDPWSLDYYDENKIPIMGTSDFRLYCMVDDEYIYDLDVPFVSTLFGGNEDVDVTWEEFENILKDKGKFRKKKSDIGKKWK